MSFLTLDNVSHYYFSKQSQTKALENISLSINEGEFVSIIGPSGCGKSTILSIIAKLLHQTEGHVYVRDQLLQNTNLKLGYMLQQDYLFPWKTIMENILIGPKIQNTLTEETKKQALTLLEEVGLKDSAHA